MSGDMIKQAQAKADQQRKDQLAELKKAGRTSQNGRGEKGDRAAAEYAGENAPVTMPDMSKVTDMMKNPAIRATSVE